MNCDKARSLLHDRLDGLLDDAEDVARLDEHVARCASCAGHHARLERVRAAMFAPYPVPPAGPDLKARILAARPRRRWLDLLRYAAGFAAGVLVTYATTSAHTEPAEPEAQAQAEAPVPEPLPTLALRRLR